MSAPTRGHSEHLRPGAPPRIRTANLFLLREAPLPIGLEGRGWRPRIRTWTSVAVSRSRAGCVADYTSLHCVGEEGLEPSRPRRHRVLKPGRLPVPPPAHHARCPDPLEAGRLLRVIARHLCAPPGARTPFPRSRAWCITCLACSAWSRRQESNPHLVVGGHRP
jgi:hypothetical protein